MTISLFHVDAFTEAPFAGNPAAVCLLTEPRDDLWMQNVAREMNLSETAFLLSQENSYSLRWFTPTVEVDLCGHATLASAHILWTQGLLPSSEQARFQTRSGLLTAERSDQLIELNFPALSLLPAVAPVALCRALGVEPIYVQKFGTRYLIEVADESAVRALRPDFTALRTMDERGVVVTSRTASGDHDFVSRYFAPWVGIDEDPVTGSVHCALTPYWAAQLGKQELVAYQASARGGLLYVRLEGDRVVLGGHAVTIAKGELCP